MENSKNKFHFPKDINLKSSPLIEAWFEIRWKLKKGSIPQTMIDPEYPFALGVFYKNVKEKFEYHEELETSKAPEGFFPHKVQHRFRVEKNKWPVLQLGPGVATANYVGDYTWNRFHKTILYLRDNLLDAYQNYDLRSEALFLRYRNAFPFDYGNKDILSFLDNKLNLSIKIPKHVPGKVSSKPNPVNLNLQFVYSLMEPLGIGKIQIASGYSKKDNGTDEKIVILELEVASKDSNTPDFSDEEKLTNWLNDSHSIIHEWFFSFIDSPLYSDFTGGNK
jgi:uncharacterized protein (TIGR04255 family)